ncbi:membrane protein [Heyndrickxia sporothermodurans]|nr:membrane protein [Heyndrickxia sporothermodurans]
MDRMYRVLGFWTGIFTVMLYLGDLDKLALLFLGQTVFFVLLSYLKLSERMYMYIFGAYLTIFFAGFTYYTTFILVPGVEH